MIFKSMWIEDRDDALNSISFETCSTNYATKNNAPASEYPKMKEKLLSKRPIQGAIRRRPVDLVDLLRKTLKMRLKLRVQESGVGSVGRRSRGRLAGQAYAWQG